MKIIKLTGKEKFLVVRTDRIGDVILSLPVLEALKRNFPQSFVGMLVSPYTQELLKNNPFADKVFLDDSSFENCGIKGFFKLKKKLQKEKVDVVILLYPTFRLALLFFLCRIRFRIGTGYRLYSIFFNKKVFEHRKNIKRHELEYNLNLLALLGITPERIKPKVYLPEREGEKTIELLKASGVEKSVPRIAIHPGSGKSSLALAPDKFALLADKIIERGKFTIIITGTEKDKNSVTAMLGQMRNKVVNLTGQTDLGQLAAVLSQCQLLITNSTGPMHLAVAVGTPVLAFFSPVFVASPKRWGPYDEKSRTLLPPVPVCSKCLKDKCEYFNCMDKFDLEEVVKQVLEILNREKK
jgi:lipopolysaccharide heptosyltransferase II